MDHDVVLQDRLAGGHDVERYQDACALGYIQQMQQSQKYGDFFF